MTLPRRFLADKKSIYFILALGLVLRLLFVLFGARIYYGRADFYDQGDSEVWINAFLNLVHHHTFTSDINIEAGKFFRPPGYSFLFGIFYLLTTNVNISTWLVIALQVAMDVASTWLIYKIAQSAFLFSTEDKKIIVSLISAFLYACYPFVIVFVPVLLAEIPSLFFLLLSIHFALKPRSSKGTFLSGLFGGIAVLFRLQTAFCLPFIALGFFINSFTVKYKIKLTGYFCLGIILTYGLWPARNIFLQHRMVFTQESNVGGYWSQDFTSFVHYVYAIQTDHTPLFNEIIQDKKVNWPLASYLDPSDSLLLDSAVHLCRKCGTGFYWWKKLKASPQDIAMPEHNCDTVIDGIFTSLLEKQKQKNPLHYWIIVPLSNLKKCFFKINLYGAQSSLVTIVSSLFFLLRTILILLGIGGLWLSLRRGLSTRQFFLITAGYMVAWYFYLSVFWRNIEMRFLLQCDVLLLIPAAFFLSEILSKKSEKKITPPVFN